MRDKKKSTTDVRPCETVSIGYVFGKVYDYLYAYRNMHDCSWYDEALDIGDDILSGRNDDQRGIDMVKKINEERCDYIGSDRESAALGFLYGNSYLGKHWKAGYIV